MAYSDVVLPRFSRINCSLLDVAYKKCMKVEYSVDGVYDVMLLNSVDKESTVYEGYLKQEHNVKVSVVVSGTNIEVSMLYVIFDLCSYMENDK